MLGASTAALLVPLARMLKHADSRVYLCSVGLLPLGESREIVDEKGFEGFDRCLPSLSKVSKKEGNTSQAGARNRLVLKTRVRKFLKGLINPILGGRHLREKFELLCQESDVLHLHGLFLSQSHYYLARASPKPLVVSCWGSDVLRSADLQVLKVQRKILQRASVITVSTPEFKEVVLAKYGRELFPKIRLAQFSPDLEGLGEEDSGISERRFRTDWNISEDKLIVCIGHNGDPAGQHLEMISSVSKLGKEMKERITVVVPMTYGGSKDYKRRVREALQEAAVAGVILESYLEERAIRDLRLASDVFVYGPVSDSFSASVSQALAAGSVCLLGSWLPYNLRRRAGFFYHEFDQPDKIESQLAEVIESWPSSQKQCAANRNLAEKNYSDEALGQAWLDVYALACQSV